MKENIRDIAPLGLRMPSEIKSWVSQKAKDEDRSMNYIILRILNDAKEKSEKPS